MQNPPSVLLMNPIEEGQAYVVDVDPVVSRHTGGKSKWGVFPPLGITSVAAVLREQGIPVEVLDPVPDGYTFETALARARTFDVVIIALAASNAQGVYRFCSQLGDTTRVFMGTHATALADNILARGYCDIIVRGEPEYTALEAVQHLDNLSDVQGVSFRHGETVVHNPDRPLIENLDELPLPARDLVDNSKYHLISFPGKPIAMVVTSRGCPFGCTYCATHLFYKRTRRVRSPESVVNEIEHVVQTYGVTYFFIADDTFNIGEERVVAICRLLQKKNLPIEWLCLCRVDTMTDAMIDAMARSGCREILYGIESASEEVLRQTKKNITVSQMKHAVGKTLQAGIRVSAFFMFGNPGEDLASVRATSALARELNPTFASFNIATPDPGTELYETVKEQLAQSTFDRFDRLNTNFSICTLSPQQLRRELVRAYLCFYFRPIFWFRLLKFLADDPLHAPSVLRVFYRQAMAVLT